MALTTLFGTVQLTLQQAIGNGLTMRGGIPQAPNFAVVSVRRDRFVAEHRGPFAEEASRFRRELHQRAVEYVEASGWRFAGFGSFVMNFLIRTIPQDCLVQVRPAESLYDLSIVDGKGERQVAVKNTVIVVGRDHPERPGAFISLDDPERVVSRRHLSLEFADLTLKGKLLGRNPTTVNAVPITEPEFMLNNGDLIRCGGCGIRVVRIGV